MQFRFTDIIPGRYQAKITDIKSASGPYGLYLRFIFTITNGELAGCSFFGIVKPEPFRQTKFHRWISIILGKEPDTDFSLSELLGKECHICLEKKTKNQKTFYSVSDLDGTNLS